MSVGVAECEGGVGRWPHRSTANAVFLFVQVCVCVCVCWPQSHPSKATVTALLEPYITDPVTQKHIQIWKHDFIHMSSVHRPHVLQSELKSSSSYQMIC